MKTANPNQARVRVGVRLCAFALSVSQSACTVLFPNGWGAVTRLTKRLPLYLRQVTDRRRTTGDRTAYRGAVSSPKR